MSNGTLKIGSESPDNIYIGADEVDKIYQGQDLIWTKPPIYGWHVDPTISDPYQAVTYLADARNKESASLYRQVEYLKSTGTQIIVTDIIPTMTERYELDLKFTSSEGQAGEKIFFGAWQFKNGTTYTRFICNWVKNNTDFTIGCYLFSDGAFTTLPTNVKTNRNVLSLFGQSGTYGTTALENVSATYPADIDLPLALFGITYGETSSDILPYSDSQMTLYAFKVFNGNELRHNMLPTERTSDGELGLFDTITGKFYVNAGTGTFEKGSYIDNHVFGYGDWKDAFFMPRPCMLRYDGTVDYYLDPNDYSRKLFDGHYRRVEYIKSTGAQVITTDIIPSYEDTLILEAKFDNFRTGTVGWKTGLVVVEAAATPERPVQRIGLTHNSSSIADSYMGYDWNTGSNYEITGLTTSDKLTYTMKKNYFSVGTLSVTPSAPSYFAEPTIPISIFGATNYDLTASATNVCDMYLYDYKIYDSNDNLIHNLIPVERISDNELGLYDISTNKFYTNSGTGTFIRGNYVSNSDVANSSYGGNAMIEWPRIWYKFESLEDKGYRAVEYIKSTGVQYIQTDIIPANNTKIKLDMQFGDFHEYANASTYNSCFCGVAEFGGDDTSEVFWGVALGELSDSRALDFYLGNVSWQESANHISNPANINMRQTMQICRGDSYWGNQTALVNTAVTKAEPTKPLAIMGFNCVDRPNFSPNPYKCRNLIIYGAMIYLNGSELSHNLIPVERISDNELGLYDVITNKFYGNAGTGTFAKGSYVEGHGFFYCSPVKVDSSYKCWCNINANDEIIPHFYTAIYNGTGTAKLRSLSGVQLTSSSGCGNTTVSDEITAALANNTANSVEWYTEVYSDRVLVSALMILIGKTLNDKGSFGNGMLDGSISAKEAYVTGSLDSVGLFYGDVTSQTAPVKIFGMENWYGCVWHRVAGLSAGTGSTYQYKLTYGTADGSTAVGYNASATGYISSSVTRPTNSSKQGLIVKMTAGVHGLLPSAIGGDPNSTYYCSVLFSDSGNYAVYGGNAVSSIGGGSQSLGIGGSSDVAWWGYGASLSCKPAKT
jgi:hypothetical protein